MSTAVSLSQGIAYVSLFHGASAVPWAWSTVASCSSTCISRGLGLIASKRGFCKMRHSNCRTFIGLSFVFNGFFHVSLCYMCHYSQHMHVVNTWVTEWSPIKTRFDIFVIPQFDHRCDDLAKELAAAQPCQSHS